MTPVPVEGTPYHVRKVSVRGFQALQRAEDAGELDDDFGRWAFMAYLCLCDADGRAVFESPDAVGDADFEPVNAAMVVVLEHNRGLMGAETDAGNSSATRSSLQSTGSPSDSTASTPTH